MCASSATSAFKHCEYAGVIKRDLHFFRSSISGVKKIILYLASITPLITLSSSWSAEMYVLGIPLDEKLAAYVLQTDQHV